MKNKNLILLIILSVILLSGCSTVLGENTLLRPPRATGDAAEIQKYDAKVIDSFVVEKK